MGLVEGHDQPVELPQVVLRELPGVMRSLADGSLPVLCHTIAYDGI